MNRSILRCAVVAMLSLCAVPAAADDDDQNKQRAEALLADGNDKASRGDHLGALEAFEAAYAVFPSPRLLVSIGSASWNLGRFTAAAEAYERFLAQADADDEMRPVIEGKLAELDKVTAKLAIEVSVDGAVILVDGKRVAFGERAVTVRVDPGKHTVVVNQPEYRTATRSVTVPAGSSIDVRIALAAIPQAAPPKIVREVVVRDRVVDTSGKVGAAVHIVADPEGPGGAVLAGASYGVLDRLDVSAGAIVGPHAGGFASATLYMTRGSVRPLATAATPTFLVDGELRPGLRGAIGVEWIPTLRVALTVHLAVEYYPTATEQQVDTLFAPSFGVVTRM